MSSPAPRLKLVVRRLPPTLPESTFWAAVAPFIDGKHAWRRYVAGRAADAYGGHAVHSRAYVLMADADALLAFHRGFDGHVFRAKSGAEFQAVVEFAPVQKTPVKAKAKPDARAGTIDDDPDYAAFLQVLNGTGPSTAAADSAATMPAAPAAPTSTPLLDHLRSKKAAKSGGGDKGGAGKKGAAADASGGAGSSAGAASRAPGGADKAKAGKTGKAGRGKGDKTDRGDKPDRVDKTDRPDKADRLAERAREAKESAVVMVAGKGREVLIVPAAHAAAPQDGGAADGDGGEGKKAKGKKKKAGKDGKDGKADGAGAPGGSPRADGRDLPHAANETAEVPERAGPGERGGRGGRGRGGGGGGGGRGRGGGDARRGRGGGAAGSGGGDAPQPPPGGQKDRSARGAIVSILSRNAEAAGRGRGRGGGPVGGGRGAGGGEGGAGMPAAAAARIDD